MVTLHVKLIRKDALRLGSFYLPDSIANENRLTKDTGKNYTQACIDFILFKDTLIIHSSTGLLYTTAIVFWFGSLLDLG